LEFLFRERNTGMAMNIARGTVKPLPHKGFDRVKRGSNKRARGEERE